MFKDPNILALIAYLAGHAVQYLTTRTLRIPAAAVAKTPALGVVNALEDSITPIAEAAVSAAIAKKLAPPTPAVKVAPVADIYGNPIGTTYTFGPDGQPRKAVVADTLPAPVSVS